MLQKIKAKLRGSRGYVLVLVALALPLLFAGVTYLIKSNDFSHKETLETAAAGAVGAAILKAYDPYKSFNVQKDTLYSAGAQALNDKAYGIFHEMMLEMCSLEYLKQKYVSEYQSIYLLYKIQHPSWGKAKIQEYADERFQNKHKDQIGKAIPDSTKFDMSFDDSKGAIISDLKCINRKAILYPAECPVDIIMTVPTKNSAPTETIATGFKEMLQEHFSNIKWIAAGIIPYSGKISIPTNRADSWTVKIPGYYGYYPNTQEPTLCQAQVYASKGQGYKSDKTPVENAITDDSDYTWNYSIMSRLCTTNTMRPGIVMDKLLSTDSPTIGNENGYEFYKFRRMNLNPCYLGYCNLLGDRCEKACTTYSANPYPICELTDNVSNVMNTLASYKSVTDDFNKSNFLFLPVQWACNLLSPWTAHPEEPNGHPARDKKKKAVILVINAPNNFEPKELTYLGFNNDAAVLPMSESDTIAFRQDKKTGTKGIISYSGDGTYSTTYSEFEVSNGTGRLSFKKCGLIKVVVARFWTKKEATIKFTNLSKNVNYCAKNSMEYPLYRGCDLPQEFYIDASQISNTQDSNGNYYITFEMSNISLISAEITNRKYNLKYQSEATCYQISESQCIVQSTHVPEPFKITFKQDKRSSITISDNKVGENKEYDITGKSQEEFKFDYLTGYMDSIKNRSDGKPLFLSFNSAPEKKFGYKLENAEIISCQVADRRLRWSGGTDDGDESRRDEGMGYVIWADEAVENKDYLGIKCKSHHGYIQYSLGGKTVPSGKLDLYYWTDGLTSLYNPYIDIETCTGVGDNQTSIYEETQLKGVRGKGNAKSGWKEHNDISMHSCDRFRFVECNGEVYKGELSYSRFVYKVSGTHDMSYDNNEVNFVGTGNITLKVKSTVSKPKITLKKKDGTDVSFEFTDSKELTIDPDTYKFRKSDTSYCVDFTLTNAKVDSFQQLHTTTGIEYPKISAPTHCAYVDYSKNISGKPSISDNNLVNIITIRTNPAPDIVWDEDAGYWKAIDNTSAGTADARSAYNNVYNEIYSSSLTVNGVTYPQTKLDGFEMVDDPSTHKYSFMGTKFYTGGLYRWFEDSSARNSKDFWFDIYATNTNSPLFVYAGYVLPINYVLLNHQTFRNRAYTHPKAALDDVAGDACSKLKEQIGEDGKIYLIKYGTSDTTLDSCASKKDNEDNQYYNYSVNNAEDLKNKLNEIAEDIKNMAGYKDTRVVLETTR